MLPSWRFLGRLGLLLAVCCFSDPVSGVELPPVVQATGAAGTGASTTETPWSDFCAECDGAGCSNCQLAGGPDYGGLNLFGGVEYLEARPTFSEPLAFIRQVRATAPDPNGVLEHVDQDVHFQFDRKDNLRAFMGLRLNDCGSELGFTYTRLRSSDLVTGTAGVDAAGNEIRYDIWDVNAVVPGDQLIASSRVAGDVYDLEYKRAIRWPGSCDSLGVCDAAGGCCVPWQLHWSAGTRIAEWQYDTSVVSTGASSSRADVLMEYDGAGPIVGLDGTRSLRILPRASIYASFHTALLLGDIRHELVRTAVIGPNTSRAIFSADQKRMVPVTEFEVGVRWRFGRYLNLAGGWFQHTWWDLGMSEDVVRGGDSDPELSGIDLVRDDANIMAWDGLTLRLELTY